MKQKLFAAFAGYSLVGIASGLFVYSGLGADCFNSLVKGITPFFGFEIGTTSYLVQMAMLALLLLLGGRKHAGPGTIFGSLIVSVIVNLFGGVLAPVFTVLPLAGKMTAALIGTPLAGLGLAMVQQSGLGSTANDILPILISEHLPRFQFRTVRVAFDCAELLIGFALGVLPGFTTLCAALLIGPCIQASLRLLNRPGHPRHVVRRAR